MEPLHCSYCGETSKLRPYHDAPNGRGFTPLLCEVCWSEEYHHGGDEEPDYGGVWDGFSVQSDADPGL